MIRNTNNGYLKIINMIWVTKVCDSVPELCVIQSGVWMDLEDIGIHFLATG